MLLPEHTWNVVKVKVQAKVTLPRVIYDGIRGTGVTDPFILNFGTCALSGQLHALAALTLEKKTPVRTAQEPQWTLRKNDKFLDSATNWTTIPRTVQPVRCSGSCICVAPTYGCLLCQLANYTYKWMWVFACRVRPSVSCIVLQRNTNQAAAQRHLNGRKCYAGHDNWQKAVHLLSTCY